MNLKEPQERIWTCIAAERDGRPLEEDIGKRTQEIEIHHAWRMEADSWAKSMAKLGYEIDGPSPLATFEYRGDTDSSSNCWITRARRELKK